MNGPQPSSPLPLEYEATFREERLLDGTLRLTVPSDRGRGLRSAGILVGMGVIATVLCFVLWSATGSLRMFVYGLAFGPLCIVLAGVAAVSQLVMPRSQTHVVEVNASGLTLQTFISGDPVVRRHGWLEILHVNAGSVALEVHTTRDQYVCMSFVKPEHLRMVADIIKKERAKHHPTARVDLGVLRQINPIIED